MRKPAVRFPWLSGSVSKVAYGRKRKEPKVSALGGSCGRGRKTAEKENLPPEASVNVTSA
jgi:hypothetical protein